MALSLRFFPRRRKSSTPAQATGVQIVSAAHTRGKSMSIGKSMPPTAQLPPIVRIGKPRRAPFTGQLWRGLFMMLSHDFQEAKREKDGNYIPVPPQKVEWNSDIFAVIGVVCR
jgi:hypothetical protein